MKQAKKDYNVGDIIEIKIPNVNILSLVLLVVLKMMYVERILNIIYIILV